MLVDEFDKTELTNRDLELFRSTICKNPYIKFKPYPKQSWAIFLSNKPITTNFNRVLVGAGGYGGKTYLGSMLAAQYLENRHYKALVTRRNYAELTGEDSIWENLLDWCCDEDRLGPDFVCEANESKLLIKSPFGARIRFKAFDHAKKKGKLKSESYLKIINDESSENVPEVLSFQPRSLRRSKETNIPLAIIDLSNPGGDSTDYLIQKYVDGKYPYIALDWRDNPTINQKEYSATLDDLDYVDQQYQKYGNWKYKPSMGDLIDFDTINKRTHSYNGLKFSVVFNVLSIDLAGEGTDKTAIANYLFLSNGKGFIEDLYQTMSPYPEESIYRFIESKLKDGFNPNLILIEQEGGSKVYSDRHWESDLRPLGIPIQPINPKGSKYNRARPLVRDINYNNILINEKLKKKLYHESKTQETYFDLLTDELLRLEPIMKISPNLIDCLSQARNFVNEKILSSTSSGMQVAQGV